MAADLNGDGKADLVYTDYGVTATASTTHVLLSKSDGSFAAGQTIATAGAAIAAADFDHDGHVDLVWVWGVVGEGKVFLAHGNGDGTFAGGVASLQVAVAPQTGYMQPVQLSCADLPSEAACTFAAHTIPAGGGTTTLQLTTMAPRSCAVADSGTTAGLPFASTTVAALLVILIPGKRRRAVKGLLVALVALCGMATLSGCGACTDLGTKPGTYTIRVVGTSAANVVTTKVQVTVTAE